jgi:hypothetical protein
MMRKMFLAAAVLSVWEFQVTAQTHSVAENGDWAVGRWEGHTYPKGSRTPMNATAVVLQIEKRPDGKLVCQMSAPTADLKKSVLDHCEVGQDGIRLTSLSRNRYDLRRQGKTLKGSATTEKGGVFEAELNQKG